MVSWGSLHFSAEHLVHLTQNTKTDFSRKTKNKPSRGSQRTIHTALLQVLWMCCNENSSYFITHIKTFPMQSCKNVRLTNGAHCVFGLPRFLTETGFQAMRQEPALICTTSSHFFSLCQQHCKWVSHSYAATDGPISLLQLCGWHDSWGSVSWFRVSFIFLHAHGRGEFL